MTKEKHYGRKSFRHDTFEQNTFDRGVSFAPNADLVENGRNDRNEGVTQTRRRAPKTAGKSRRPLSPMWTGGEAP